MSVEIEFILRLKSIFNNTLNHFIISFCFYFQRLFALPLNHSGAIFNRRPVPFVCLVCRYFL